MSEQNSLPSLIHTMLRISVFQNVSRTILSRGCLRADITDGARVRTSGPMVMRTQVFVYR